ncbi:cytochrome c oxidase assembly protein [Curtobacterium sp. ISL-83]|uniref:cytochrome c oxidase assembly protein n=1 Tax=Curtobacterium sp. ISL-83 TaxID=2819145 RepID=UPI001BE889C9|nr:cytochrome c oxidase assembly protein [Curtobacterium sp. ISL-83]MBT2502589.1 bifunctional copper resistance protein CopD/cytochrome c oxidase assembly protein [Curtobacterium sp. ISL-83]
MTVTSPLTQPGGTAPDSAPVTARSSTVATVLVIAIPLAIASVLLGMTVTGAFTANQQLLSAGDLVEYGLPVTRVVHDTMAALTVGLLIVAAFALPAQKKDHGAMSSVQHRASRWAAITGGVWFLAAVVGVVLTGANTLGVPLTSPVFARNFLLFAFQIEIGQALVVSAAAILIATVVAAFATRATTLAVATVAALFALLPLALSGHAAGSLEHANAVNSLAVHLIAVCVWAGGLVAVLLLRTSTKGATGRVVARYSTLAGWSFAAVAFSGVVNASLRLTGPLDLVTTTYGWLITVKAVILVLLGLAGVVQRRRLVPALLRSPLDRRSFTRFAVAEVVFMSVAIGVSVAVSRSQPPIPQTPATGEDARSGLIGFPFPPPQTIQTYLTQWHIDWMWAALALVGAGWYLLSVRKLRKRGDSWPVGRTIAWLLGCALFIWTTSAGPAVYGMIHFSSHMIQHMLLMMFVPLPLVLGGPVLLALRTLPVRNDGSRGAREWLMLFVHSRWMQFLGKPAVAGVIFAGSLVVFYFTPAYQYAMESHEWHVVMIVHFVFSGYLFFWVFVGVDPGPKRPQYPILIIALLATLAFHAFFGVAVMTSESVFAVDWFHALGQTNNAALLADQHTGGGIAWGASELPMVFVALLVVRNWMRTDKREAKRLDRKADRDGDADLKAYNDRLAAINERD